MPLYEYRCEQCNQTMEVLQRLGDPAPGSCPSCGGTLVKVLSAPALQFKGSGWYVTDYGRGSGRRAGDGNGNGNGSGGSESKPASTEAASKPASDSAAKPAKSTDS